MARFGAYPSVVLDVSKEAGGYGVGDDYVQNRMRMMRSMNAHGRLITAHSGFSWNDWCTGASDLCDLISAQHHLARPGQDTNRLAPFKHHSNASIATRSEHAYAALYQIARGEHVKPYINVEFFYQWGPVDGCHFACCGTCR